MPVDPGAAGVRQHPDALGEIAPCRQCGATIRRSWHRILGLHINVELWPVTPDPTWSPEWEHQTFRWQKDAMGDGGSWCSVVFRISKGPIYVAHHCAATNNP